MISIRVAPECNLHRFRISVIFARFGRPLSVFVIVYRCARRRQLTRDVIPVIIFGIIGYLLAFRPFKYRALCKFAGTHSFGIAVIRKNFFEGTGRIIIKFSSVGYITQIIIKYCIFYAILGSRSFVNALLDKAIAAGGNVIFACFCDITAPI